MIVVRLLVLLSSVLVAGCGLTTQVRPTPKGQLAIQGAVGGPAADVGVPVPLPLTTVGVAYGVHDRADLSFHTHLTTLALARFFGADVGLAWLANEQDGAAPAVTLGLRGYAFTDFSTATLGFYEVAVATSWECGRFRPFLAVALQLDNQALAWDFAPAAGTEIAFGRFTLVLELTWFAPNRDTSLASVPWASIFGHGALGLTIGGRYTVLAR